MWYDNTAGILNYRGVLHENTAGIFNSGVVGTENTAGIFNSWASVVQNTCRIVIYMRSVVVLTVVLRGITGFYGWKYGRVTTTAGGPHLCIRSCYEQFLETAVGNTDMFSVPGTRHTLKYVHVSPTQYTPHTEKHTLFFNIRPMGVTMTGRFGLPLGPFISRITY